MKLVIIFLTMTFSCVSYAGPGHGHSHSHKHKALAVSTKKAQEIGRTHVNRLASPNKKGLRKIDESWKNSKFVKAEKKVFGGQKEWVLTFNNEKGVKGKNLYIFLKEDGHFVAANFTGK